MTLSLHEARCEAPCEAPPPDLLLSERRPLPLSEQAAPPAQAVQAAAPRPSVAPAPPAPRTLLLLQAAVARVPGRSFGPFGTALAAGERIAILGPSGAGKSTLLKLMAGERAAHSGEVWLDDRRLPDWPLRALARRRAVLPQAHGVAFGMPVPLVVALGRIACEPDAAQATIVELALHAACAAHLAGRRFDTLSGGEQARVQLARVMAQLWDMRGALLLVDEPLAALDPGLQFDLMDALRSFAAERGHALVAVLHDLNQALAGFERLWLVQGGQLVGDLRAGAGAVASLERLFGIGLRCVPGEDGRVAVLAQRRPAVAVASTAQAA